MNKNERPITKDMMLAALTSKTLIIQQSKPFSKKESDLDRLKRELNRFLAAYF